MMDPVPLDDALIARFKDKTMAIVGYESDQVHYWHQKRGKYYMKNFSYTLFVYLVWYY